VEGAKAEQKNVPRDFHYVGRMWGRFNIAPESQMYSGPREDIAERVRMVRRVRDSIHSSAGIMPPARPRRDGVHGVRHGARCSAVEWVLRDDCSVPAPKV
jgi:hypothetical protein